LTVIYKYGLIIMLIDADYGSQTTLIFTKATIAYDKGKPAARQRRKTVSLFERKFELDVSTRQVFGEIVWSPKAVGESLKLTVSVGH